MFMIKFIILNINVSFVGKITRKVGEKEHDIYVIGKGENYKFRPKKVECCFIYMRERDESHFPNDNFFNILFKWKHSTKLLENI